MEKDPISNIQPLFKIPYQECKTHEQKMNYICLGSQCHQSSIICSVCKDQKHSKHTTKPLKFYMKELEQNYHHPEGESTLNQLFEELQVSEFTFYKQLKKAVENVAEQFQKLEEDVMQQFQIIKNQIFEEVKFLQLKIAKRNRFNQFYDNLRRGKIQESNFILQNYLPQTSIGNISNFEIIQKLSQKICNDIQSVKKDLFSTRTIGDQSKSLKKQLQRSGINYHNEYFVFDLNKVMKTPPNINYIYSVLTQKDQLHGAKSLCLIDHPVTQISGQLNFYIQKMNKLNSVMISVMTKEVYDAMKECWSQAKLKDKAAFVIGNNGFTFGWNKQQITQFGQGSTLSLSYRSNELRINQKSKYCTALISPDTKFYVVLALMGECQVKVTHKK